jgi:hypothetical protein
MNKLIIAASLIAGLGSGAGVANAENVPTVALSGTPPTFDYAVSGQRAFHYAFESIQPLTMQQEADAAEVALELQIGPLHTP